MRLASLICRLYTSLVLLATGAYGQDDLPSADAIIRDYIDALGSEMSLLGIESLRMRGTYSGPAAGTIDFKSKGDKWIVQMGIAGLSISSGFDGKYYWRQANNSNQIVQGREADDMKSYFQSPTQILNWLEYDGEIRVVGESEFEGVLVYQLEFKTKSGSIVNHFFDKSNGLLIKTTSKNASLSQTQTLQYEYREIQGIKFISKTRFEVANQSGELEYDEIEINPELDDQLLELPDGFEDEIKRIEREKN